jgi:sugar phosphate isomerase/epimerase
MRDINRITFPTIPMIHHPWEKTCQLIAEAGYKNVDIIDKPPHWSVFPDEADHKAIKKTAEKYGLRITSINGYFGGGQSGRFGAWKHHPGFQFPNADRYTKVGFASSDPKDLEKEMDQTKKAIDCAAFFGSELLRFVPGDEDEKKLEQMLPYLKEMTRYAKEKNVTMVCENHDTGILGQPETLVKMCEMVGYDNIGIIYEPLNLMEQATIDYRKAFEVQRDIIKMVHLKDGFLDPSKRTYVPTLFGEGDMDYEWVVNRLEAIGYKGYIGLEYEVAGLPVEKGAKQYLDGYKKMVGMD